MAIEIRESFEVDAAIDAVWAFVMDPHKMVSCMPGAKLEEVVDEQTYLGSVKIKVGAVTASYKGKVQFTEVDEQSHRVALRAEGKETGGGTAKGTVTSQLRELAPGRTEVVTDAQVDLTGKIMQVGRRMIEGVSHQIFLQFVNAAKAGMEGPAEQGAAAATGDPAAPPPPAVEQPIAIVPLVLRTLWVGLLNFFRRLTRRGT